MSTTSQKNGSTNGKDKVIKKVTKKKSTVQSQNPSTSTPSSILPKKQSIKPSPEKKEEAK
jgi:hypothetical protein